MNNPAVIAQMRDALDQAGQDGDGRISGGLGVGSVGPAPGVGELALLGSIRDSLALGAVVTLGADQAIPNVTMQVVSWDAEQWDSDSIWAAGSAGRFTVHTGGVYLFYAFVNWELFAAGVVFLAVLKNGVEVVSRNDLPLPVTQPQLVSGFVAAMEGDYFEVVVYHDTGAALNLEYLSYRPMSAGIVRIA